MSIGLGGDSIVRQQQDGSVTVGPDSVGYKITDEALTFGGNIITATDIAVRLGLSDVGDPQLTKQISLKFAQAALQTISDMIAVAIDKMKTSAEPATVILVGGGVIIAPHRVNTAEFIHTTRFRATRRWLMQRRKLLPQQLNLARMKRRLKSLKLMRYRWLIILRMRIG
ncbi:hypothetical protein FAM8407_02279 [Lacticaseibacillus paracasei]|uniref:N-methylhydantoinase (ATP-hydrolyzing) n=1 Tax=Lacticaseibacillus paracasei subsp. paracasei Lpp122 TaxID=1256218 RepID=A0A8E0I477_LACPA|nr:N-methylhydantoinase (ATP-hydrolyzing) [Lacticaseibacillus paracasei subsp. paracasei Lpp122]RNE44074.1 hypothetical protein FAM8407_02279 [Lacticaseibacillus paracasei]